MDILSTEFFSALLAIVLIDLVLAGDNAIVIALAARRLPPNLQRRAVIWGSVGAVIVRSTMTLAVVWLLKVPGLLLAGGALLLWIAYKLMAPTKGHGEDGVDASTTFLGAMKTIVIADAVMGVDNVLAVAGAAHGNYVLVVLGLVISVPIVVWGSTLLLRLTERFPVIVTLGAGVLAFTGVKMMMSEPLVKPWLDELAGGAPMGGPALSVLIYLLGVGGVLLAGLLRQSSDRLALAQQAHSSRVTDSSRVTEATPMTPLSQPKEMTMTKVLIPVDGTDNAMAAVRHVLGTMSHDKLDVVVLNVQPALTRRIGRHVPAADRDGWREARAQAATRQACAELTRQGVAHRLRIGVGAPADTISRIAREDGCDRIVVGTARKHSLTRLLENSVTTRLLDTASVPVEVVTGRQSSRWERWGLPATLGAALATAMAVAD